MSRFPEKQIWDRKHGPPPGATGDGINQGAIYSAVVASAITASTVFVTIPALHLSQTFQAQVQPGLVLPVGSSCVVAFDEQKKPWIVTNNSVVVPSLSALEATVTAYGVSLTALKASPVWKTPVYENSWKALGGEWDAPAYTKDPLGWVTMRGFVTSGTSNAAFILPVGFRPGAAQQYATAAAGPALGIVQIQASGQVALTGAQPVGLWGVHYYAEG